MTPMNSLRFRVVGTRLFTIQGLYTGYRVYILGHMGIMGKTMKK